MKTRMLVSLLRWFSSETIFLSEFRSVERFAWLVRGDLLSNQSCCRAPRNQFFCNLLKSRVGVKLVSGRHLNASS